MAPRFGRMSRYVLRQNLETRTDVDFRKTLAICRSFVAFLAKLSLFRVYSSFPVAVSLGGRGRLAGKVGRKEQ